MPEPITDLLTGYVDERTPEQAPPFGAVERGVRRRRRRRNLLSVATVLVVAAGAALVTSNLQRAEEPAAPDPTPAIGALDDGPPPARFMFGNTLLVLRKEIPVTAVRPSADDSSVLLVETARDAATGASCLPQTMVRILSQDASTVRIAAYRYAVAPDQPEGQQCRRVEDGPLRVHLDLRSPVAGRTVLAGSTGRRVVLN